METQLSVEKFDFFKTLKVNMFSTKDIIITTIGMSITTCLAIVGIGSIYLAHARISETTGTVAQAMTSENMEQELKKIDKNFIVKKENNTFSYSFGTEISHLFGLSNIKYNFEIQQDKNSKTLIWKDQGLEDSSYKVNKLKSFLKNENIKGINIDLNAQTNRYDIVFKIEVK